MQTQNKKNANAKKETSSLTKINFEKYADKVKNFSEKTSNSQRSTIYLYPEDWNAIQINGSEGKTFRQNKRKKLLTFCNLIGLYYKMKNAEKLIEEIKNFNKFYKEFFKVNDYSINSITNTKGEINTLYIDMLNIIKDVSFANEKKNNPKKTTSKKIKKEVEKPEIKEETKNEEVK